MVRAQGGDDSVVYDTTKFKKAKYSRDIKARESGYIFQVDTEGYGIASLLLGAGRNTKEESIDFSAGIILAKKTGDSVRAGDVIATMYTSDESRFEAAEAKFLQSTIIKQEKPESRPLVLDRIE